MAKKEHELATVADKRVLAAEERATKAETKVAVLEAQLEAAGKTEEVGALVIESKAVLEYLKTSTDKIIDKLPTVDISTLSITASPSGNANKGNDKAQGNGSKQ